MRKQNWDVILNNYIKEIKEQDFEWGTLDCCLFAANFVQKITGVDYASEFRGHYNTAWGAKRALIKYGKNTLKETMNSKLKSIRPSFAKRGDVVLTYHEGQEALGICLGTHTAFKVLGKGITLIPMTKIKYAWEVK